MPKPGVRAGALRVVTIEPPVLPPPEDAAGPIPVQALLPLDGLTAPRDLPPPPVQPPPRRPSAQDYTDAQVARIAHRLCIGVVEVLGGNRGVNQLVRCTSEKVYNDLSRRSAMTKSHERMTNQPPVRARIERLRIQRPTARAAEVCVRLRQGGRFRALAVRLELVSGRWTCVALEVG